MKVRKLQRIIFGSTASWQNAASRASM